MHLKWYIFLLTTNTVIVILFYGALRFSNDTHRSTNMYEGLWLRRERGIPEKCEKDIELLILIPSSIWNFKQREAVRETWGNKNSTDAKTKLVFLIGKVHDDGYRKRFEEEEKSYRDILQRDIMESYAGLTKKSIALLKWAHLNCPTVKYALKADDDTFINIQNLVTLLRKLKPTNSILGILKSNAIPSRDKGSKWYVSEEQYPKTRYPPYTRGSAYIITGDIITPLYNSTSTVTSLFREDVFITGICRKEIGADVINLSGFDSSSILPEEKIFYARITGHHYSPRDIKEMWKELLNGESTSTVSRGLIQL